MRITRRKLRKIIQEAINSSLMQNQAIQSYVLLWCRAVDAKYGEITVDDVLGKIQGDTRMDIGDGQLWEYVEEGSPEAEWILDCDYDDLVAIMWQMVERGTLADGYEDFFELGENQ